MSDEPDFRSLGAKLLAIIPAIILVVFTNVFIAFSTAGVVLIQMLAAGCNKHVSLGAALLVAVLVHSYIVWNHKIRDYIKTRSHNE
jgi:succinate dehydrogenase hydrophobic anchor subunit